MSTEQSATKARIGLWMELVRGRSLDAIVRRTARCPGGRRVGDADVCSAVAAVHAAGLLHRDIKAQNVIRDEGGRSVLMDFGTGQEFGAPGPALAGTPLYLAPEILNGGHASPASDVYSLGVLLFLLVTGAFPVQAESVEAWRPRIASRAHGGCAPSSPTFPSPSRGSWSARSRAIGAICNRGGDGTGSP